MGYHCAGFAFSILERIELGETCAHGRKAARRIGLSVSSNGSNWVKRLPPVAALTWLHAFSILERIELGETSARCAR